MVFNVTYYLESRNPKAIYNRRHFVFINKGKNGCFDIVEQ